jgi:hypothetical protein
MNRVVVHGLSVDPRWARAAAVAISNALRVPIGDVRLLLNHLPLTLPKRLSDADAQELRAKLDALGARAEIGAAPDTPGLPCPAHGSLESSAICSMCSGQLCQICALRNPTKPLCAACADTMRQRRGWRRLRIGILLIILAVVLLWAYNDVSRRRARNDWSRTLSIAVVILRRGPVDREALDSLRAGARALQDRLSEESARYRPRSAPPFAIQAFGPIEIAEDPPAPTGADLVPLARYSFGLWRYLRTVDALAGPQVKHADMAIYVVTHVPKSDQRTHVEGVSQQGGKVGIVEVELDPKMVDFALFVTAHELFHTLGATDKYDPTGRTLIPAGLADPTLSPLYPQHHAEIMARNVVLGPTEERPPDSIAELRVGPTTAAEIGWVR